MTPSRSVRIFLGAIACTAALAALGASLHTVYARSARPMHPLSLAVDFHHGLRIGDPVYTQRAQGLERAGEVRAVHPARRQVTLAIFPAQWQHLNASTRAQCWRSPLSAEDALHALFPPVLQEVAAERIQADWKKHDDELAAVWRPILTDLLTGFLETVRADLETAVQRHEDELAEVAARHGQALATQWPTIQARLQPILREHVTPVLSELISAALAEAPKLNIAWHIARGRFAEAYQLMLEWLAEYLANLPEADRARLHTALQRAWEEARRDPLLAETFSRLGRGILEDPHLQDTLAAIYREAVTDNPQVAEFLRTEIMENERLREPFYALVDRFAPTAQSVAGMILFDGDGATRPEIVHLVRSTALRRRVAWVILETPQAAADPLPPAATLHATAGGAKR